MGALWLEGFLLGNPASIGIADKGYSFSLSFTAASLPSAVTFTRASSGTRVNVAGAFVTEVTNAARFDYSLSAVGTLLGLEIEPARTNLVLDSNAFNTANWTLQAGTTATDNFTTSPDGTTNAAKIVSDGSHGLYSAAPLVVSSTTNNTKSVYLKGVSGGEVVLLQDAQQANSSTTCNLTTAWQRFTLSELQNTGLVRLWIQNIPAGGIYVWGAQLEDAASVSSLITTSGGAATRAVDSAAFTIPSGFGHLTYTFDDASTQVVAVSPGAYTIPTNLNRRWIKTIVGSA